MSATSKRYRTIGFRIDIETRSGLDLKKTGVYPYVEDPDFDVLIVAYSPIRRYVGGAQRIGRPRLLDLDDVATTDQFKAALKDRRFQKHAYNAAFERVCLSRWLGMPTGKYLDPENWHCSAIRANVNGIFGSLDEVARHLRSPIAKDSVGRTLIKMFSRPMTPTEQRRADASCQCQTFHDPAEHPKEFAQFEDYCKQDVATEAGVAFLVPDIPDDIQSQYEMDQRINDRGFRHFRGLSEAAVRQVEEEKDRVMAELRRLTGVDNPNSNKQMLEWMDSQGYVMSGLAKDKRAEALADPSCPPKVKEALTLKGAASLSSVSKHKAALATRCADGRIRGSLQFYGAHTGREAGRGVQPQNLPRYEAPKADRLRLLHGTAGRDAPLIAKGTVRASIVPAKGHVFVVVDYNAIEARVLGWLAGEQWVLDEFTIGDGAIYEATAERMFGVNKATLMADLKACGKCGSCPACEVRSKGKISDLALGYQGGAGALVTMGAEEAGIDVGNYNDLHLQWEIAGKPGKFHEWNRDWHDYPELLRLRDLYRDARPMTVRFWKLCGRAWDVAATTGKGARFGNGMCLSMIRDGRHNRMVLPSGRSIWYRFARTHFDPANPEYVDRRTFIGKSSGVGHTRVDTHGGKLTENVTQAVARDVLFDLMLKIEAMTAQGWPGRLVLHVHDEVVLEVPEKHADLVLNDVRGMMSVAPDWAPGLPVRGAGGIMERYGK